MPRLEADVRGGFYALPTTVAALIARRIEIVPNEYYPDRPTRIIDPCCGEGEALGIIARQLAASARTPVETYGIELQPDRALKAAQRLGQVVCGDMLVADTGNFDMLYINPPYDGTLERAFLEKGMDMLRPAGLAVIVVQKKTLRPLATMLSTHFHDISIREFPEPERASYGQVVITATRNPSYMLANPATAEDLVAYARGPFGDPKYQYADADLVNPTELKPAGGRRPQIAFNPLTPTDAVRLSRTAGHWRADETVGSTRQPNDGATQRPLAPLRMGHLAQYCAAGLINNTQMDDFVISGTATKTVDKSEEDDRVVLTEKIKLEIMALDLNDWTTYQII